MAQAASGTVRGWMGTAVRLMAAGVALGAAYGAGLSYWPRLGIAIMAAFVAGLLFDLAQRGRHRQRRCACRGACTRPKGSDPS